MTTSTITRSDICTGICILAGILAVYFAPVSGFDWNALIFAGAYSIADFFTS